MITGNQRRRAVAELREASTGAYRHVDSLDVIANSVGVEVDGKSGHEVENETYATLADFIDRRVCRMRDVGDKFEQVFRCSECGEEYCMGDFQEFPWRFCPNCGAMVEFLLKENRERG